MAKKLRNKTFKTVLEILNIVSNRFFCMIVKITLFNTFEYLVVSKVKAIHLQLARIKICEKCHTQTEQ